MNFQTINPKKLFDALKWLKQYNSHYLNVNVRDLQQWIKLSEEHDKESVLENLLCEDPSIEKQYEELADLEDHQSDDDEDDENNDDAREDMQGKYQ